MSIQDLITTAQKLASQAETDCYRGTSPLARIQELIDVLDDMAVESGHVCDDGCRSNGCTAR